MAEEVQEEEKKGGLIKSKKKAVKKFRGDGIVKKGKTKCKMR